VWFGIGHILLTNVDLHAVSESGSSIDQLGSDGVVLCGPLVRLEEPAEVRGALRFLVLRVRVVAGG